jgi:hypothetical protein
MSLAPAVASDVTLEQSRAYCEQLTRVYARNFYYGRRILPPSSRASPPTPAPPSSP